MDLIVKFFILLMIVAIVVASYFAYKYMQSKSSSASPNAGKVASYSTYYNGFWMYGMLAGYPTQGQEWLQVAYLNKNYYSTGPPVTPKTAMNTYKGYTTLALAAGTYDSEFNMDSGGNITAGSVGNNSVGSSAIAASEMGPIVMAYDSTNATYFGWGIDSTNGYLYNQGVGLAYPLVPTMDSTYYPSNMNTDDHWPPYYMALVFNSTFVIDNTNYFAHTWSYGANFQCVGDILPATNPGTLSYANVLSCTVSLPAEPSSTPKAATTKYIYYLNASGTYYVNRAANVMNLGGPVMLVNSFQGVSGVTDYDSRNHMSFSLFWNSGKVCDLYAQTLKALQAGGGSCQVWSGQTGKCQLCNAQIASEGSDTGATCKSCDSSSICNQPSINSAMVGYWYEFAGPAANPN